MLLGWHNSRWCLYLKRIFPSTQIYLEFILIKKCLHIASLYMYIWGNQIKMWIFWFLICTILKILNMCDSSCQKLGISPLFCLNGYWRQVLLVRFYLSIYEFKRAVIPEVPTAFATCKMCGKNDNFQRQLCCYQTGRVTCHPLICCTLSCKGYIELEYTGHRSYPD